MQSTTLQSNEYVNTRGKRNYELSNHLGNVLAVVSDRRTGVCSGSNLVSYEAELVSATDYYAFGSPMPGRQGIQKCSTVNVTTTTTTNIVNEDFNSGTVGGFVAGSGSRTVSNVSNALHLASAGSTPPLATRSITVTSGTTYTINLNLTAIGTVSGNAKFRIVGGTSYTYTTTGAITPITFTATGSSVTFEISTTGSGAGTIDIDNFTVSYTTTTTTPTTVCSIFDKGYRYGFGGKEKDNEINVNGGDYDFGARIYDSRLGRWYSLDPLMKKYPSFSAYSAFGNCPLVILDPDGKEIINGHDKVVEKQNYIKVQTAIEIVNLVLPDLLTSAAFKDYKITIKIGPLGESSEITASGDGNNTQMSNEVSSDKHKLGKIDFGISKTFKSFEEPTTCEKGSSTLSIAMKKDDQGNPLIVDGKEVLEYKVTTNTPVLVNGVYEYKTEVKEVSATEANDYINLNKDMTIILSESLIFSKSLASVLSHELGHAKFNIENKATVLGEDKLQSKNESSEMEGAIPSENDFDNKVKKVQVKEGEKIANEKANEKTGG